MATPGFPPRQRGREKGLEKEEKAENILLGVDPNSECEALQKAKPH